MVFRGDSPFDRYDLDAREGIEAITQRLKELAADATSDTERDELRTAWEQLTLHPAERLRAALFAYPVEQAPVGTPPMPTRRRDPKEGSVPTLGLRDLAARPSVLVALGNVASEVDDGDDVPSLDDDPLLRV